MTYNVYCVLKAGKWKGSKMKGEYKPEHVDRLHSLVMGNTNIDIRFHCLTDYMMNRPYNLVALDHRWPGWWPKIELFRPDLIQENSTNLYIDLDVDIINNIDHFMTEMKDGFTVLDNMTKPGIGRIGSGLMGWKNINLSYLYKTFAENDKYYMSKHLNNEERWGDQGFIQDQHEGTFHLWQEQFPDEVRSVKLTEPHKNNRILLSHGSPKPWE